MKNSLAPSVGETGGLYRDRRRWLRAKVRRPADADDLAQGTFVRVLGQIPLDTLPLREPRAYLATVAARLAANFYRRQAVEPAYLDVLASLPPQQVPSLETQALAPEALREFDRINVGSAASR